MNEDAKRAEREYKREYMREYMREWRINNRSKVKEINERYWTKKAESGKGTHQ